MGNSEKIGKDLSYLSGKGADAPQKEDIESVIKPLEYKELEGQADSEEDLVASINESDESIETKKGEFVILERKVKSELPGFDFYIARKQKEGSVFEPETVLVAKRNNVHYIQKLNSEINESYSILNEKNKLLSPDELNILNEQESIPTGSQTDSSGWQIDNNPGKTGSGNTFKKSKTYIGIGGTALVYPAVLREEKKFIPKGVAIKKLHGESYPTISEQDILLIIKKLKEVDPEAWQYLMDPIDTVENYRNSGVWELLSSSKENILKVEDLHNKIQMGDFIPFEKKLTIILQLFKALSTTSKLGMVHRDVKPANILLTPQGIKLCDFSLMSYSKKLVDPKYSKKISNLPDFFHTVEVGDDIIFGTPAYIHPRIFRDNYPDNDREINNPRYDVYSAIITSIELLTDGDTSSKNILKGSPYVWFREYDESIKEIAHRFQSAFEQDVVQSSVDKNEAENFVKLVERTIGDCRDNNAPIEELLPSPDEIIVVLKKMGVKEKY